MQVLASNELHWPVKLEINFIIGNLNECKNMQALASNDSNWSVFIQYYTFYSMFEGCFFFIFSNFVFAKKEKNKKLKHKINN